MGVIIPEGFGVAKMRWKILTAPDEMIVTCGYLSGGAQTAEEDSADISAAFRSGSAPGNAGKVSTKYQCVGVECTLMTATGPVTGETVSRITGTGTGTPLTPNTSVLIKKITARGGRKGRGRMFAPGCGVSEIDVDENGIIGASDLNSLEISWDAFYTAWAALSCPPYLLHSDSTLPDAITSFEVEPLVATQRRRLRR